MINLKIPHQIENISNRSIEEHLLNLRDFLSDYKAHIIIGLEAIWEGGSVVFQLDPRHLFRGFITWADNENANLFNKFKITNNKYIAVEGDYIKLKYFNGSLEDLNIIIEEILLFYNPKLERLENKESFENIITTLYQNTEEVDFIYSHNLIKKLSKIDDFNKLMKLGRDINRDGIYTQNYKDFLFSFLFKPNIKSIKEEPEEEEISNIIWEQLNDSIKWLRDRELNNNQENDFRNYPFIDKADYRNGNGREVVIYTNLYRRDWFINWSDYNIFRSEHVVLTFDKSSNIDFRYFRNFESLLKNIIFVQSEYYDNFLGDFVLSSLNYDTKIADLIGYWDYDEEGSEEVWNRLSNYKKREIYLRAIYIKIKNNYYEFKRFDSKQAYYLQSFFPHKLNAINPYYSS